MKLLGFLVAALMLAPGARAESVPAPRQSVPLDRDWKFQIGESPGAERPDFPDSAWRSLDVPHDFSIEGPAGADPAAMEGPFDAKSPAGPDGGCLNAGVAWYRKAFTLPDAWLGREVAIRFDGVYMDSDVYLNGQHLGNWPYGYTSFQYRLTPHVKFGGARNVLAVRVNVRQPCSRWYSGAGIYRHVYLMATGPVHVAPWGVCITTPEATDALAVVRVRTEVQNDSAAAAPVLLTAILLDPAGKEVARAESSCDLPAGQVRAIDRALRVEAPRLWSPETASLYSARCEVRAGGALTDACTTRLGIRTVRFTADNGLLVNGKRVQIRGVCDHHDLGPLGAIANRRGMERQLEILRTMGCNAIRTSHNPPDPALLDLCDEMGFLVMDEAFDEWQRAKTKYGYARFFDAWSERDLAAMIRRDRNHPSVILWSVGNEVPEQADAAGAAVARRLVEICHREDPTRPVTAGCQDPVHAVPSGFEKELDVFGINYKIEWYPKARGKLLVASETVSAISSRGEYGLVLDKDGKVKVEPKWNSHLTSYDHLSIWGSKAENTLRALRDCPWVAGEFVWTGFDYLGEPAPIGWPARSSYFGILDICGFPKDRFYLYQSQWTDRPVVHLLPHWNHEGFEGREIRVVCYTNAESVELFLNGRSLGKRDWRDNKTLHLEWQVPYAPGTLKAVASKGGRVVATETVATAGKPARIALTPDRDTIAADGEDLS
ncbi:MAG: glycoside hydrolase family 2 TIM barrel-domain containing protein, partial [Thermoguttaceae bacterium]